MHATDAMRFAKHNDLPSPVLSHHLSSKSQYSKSECIESIAALSFLITFRNNNRSLLRLHCRQLFAKVRIICIGNDINSQLFHRQSRRTLVAFASASMASNVKLTPPPATIAFFDCRPCCVQAHLLPVDFTFFEFRFSCSTNIYLCNASCEFCKPFLQFFAVIIGSAVCNLSPNPCDSILNLILKCQRLP